MNRVITYIFLILQFLSFTFASDNDVGMALRKSFPIQIYMGICVVGRADPKAVESQALKMGFREADNETSQKYLRGNDGVAWHLINEQGEFGVTVLSNTLCSVFIHQGDPATLQKSMEAWQPPENSGFIYKKEIVSQSGYLTTTSYKIFRGSQLMEQWVITINSQPGAGLVAIMSYEGP